MGLAPLGGRCANLAGGCWTSPLYSAMASKKEMPGNDQLF